VQSLKGRCDLGPSSSLHPTEYMSDYQATNDPRVDALLKPPRLWSRDDVLTAADVLPRKPGVYAWYFRELPPGVPTAACVRHGDLTLLYVGIAPKEPPKNGRKPSSTNLRQRIRYHMRGNAYGSTLRFTLGCLLADQLGIQLRRVGSGKRLTFASGETKLSERIARNAFVCWIATPDPWALEAKIISSIDLPLNLAQNSRHPFCPMLSAARRDARIAADGLPIWRRGDPD
jgi:hypothetical protein